ncbi:hypothetical protein QUF72_21795 [Desulfobacterales bacterium HSG2]|nr:hypothetical protein [Desulfobacterales bacterium HSG2]
MSVLHLGQKFQCSGVSPYFASDHLASRPSKDIIMFVTALTAGDNSAASLRKFLTVAICHFSAVFRSLRTVFRSLEALKM